MRVDMTNRTGNPFALDPCRWPGCEVGASTAWSFPDDSGWVMCGTHTELFIQQWGEARHVEPIPDSRDHPWVTEQPYSWFPAGDRSPSRENERVYYVLVGDLIKVGYTTHLQSRLSHYPPGSELLAARPGTREDEARFHATHGQYRAYGNEWYRDCPEMRAVVQAVLDEHGPPELLTVMPREEKQAVRISGATRSRRRVS